MLCVVVHRRGRGRGFFRHKENDITSMLEETFTVTEDFFGEHTVVELRPGSATHVATEANKGVR